MTDLQQNINDLSTFMQAPVFSTLDDNIQRAICAKKAELCAEYVIDIASKLHRNKFKGCYAPHKAVLLIAVAELVKEGVITSNVIHLDKELRERFKQVWGKCVPYGSPFKCEIRNPFTYMDNEELWDLSSDKNKAYLSWNAFCAFAHEETCDEVIAFLQATIVNDTISDEYQDSQRSIGLMAAEDMLGMMIVLPMVGMMMAV